MVSCGALAAVKVVGEASKGEGASQQAPRNSNREAGAAGRLSAASILYLAGGGLREASMRFT
jgi:hypothetical protein